MTTDSVTQLVEYQRNIGALPKGANFSVRTNWAGPLGRMGGSVRNYLAGYKGVTTYKTLVGLQGTTTTIGTICDLLNGANANDASQSASWNAIMVGILNAYNKANSTGYGIAMQSFTISSPASNVANLQDLATLAGTLLQELSQTNSVTASGQFQLDIQTGNFSLIPLNIPPADPRPVFDWSLTISLDSNTHSITLEIDVTYDHMEHDIGAEIVAGLVGDSLTGGVLFAALGGDILGWTASSIVGGVAVGQTINQVYNAKANSTVLNVLGKPWSMLPWVDQSIQFTIEHPTNTKFVISVTYQIDSTTWNELVSFFNNAELVAAAASVLGF